MTQSHQNGSANAAETESQDTDAMNLTLLLPEQILLDVRAAKIGGDAVNGSFVVLPHHIDFVTALVPGILTIQTVSSPDRHPQDTPPQPRYLAIDHGILVKRGASVWVSVLQAIQGDDLEHLDQVVEEEFRQMDERQKQTQTALAQLEVSFMRGMTNLGRSYRES